MNAATAFISCLILKEVLDYKLSFDNIKNGFKTTVWAGRFEIIKEKNPFIIIDGAHNVQAAKSLRKEIEFLMPNNKCILLCGIMSTKDIEGICSELSKIAYAVVATSPLPPKSITSSELAKIYSDMCDNVYDIENVETALEKAINSAKKNNAPLIVAGSIYLAGQVRTLILG